MDRRDFLKYAGAGSVVPVVASRVAAGSVSFHQQFEDEDWSDWGKDGVSNLRIADGAGVLEAATNIYPSDRRAAVFRTDERAVNAEISATISRQGVGPGLVLRRVGPETYYGAVFEREAGVLKLFARVDGEEAVLARLPVGVTAGEQIDLSLRTLGTEPTRLRATIAPAESPQPLPIEVTDSTELLQRPGDPGVLGTAETGFRAGPDWRTPIGTQSARAVWVTDNFEEGDDGGLRNSDIPIEDARRRATERTSTIAFESII